MEYSYYSFLRVKESSSLNKWVSFDKFIVIFSFTLALRVNEVNLKIRCNEIETTNDIIRSL